MKSFLTKLIALGTDAHTNPETVTKTRLTNSISLLASSVAIIILFYTLAIDWSIKAVLMSISVLIITSIPIALSYFEKLQSPRFFLAFACNFSVLILAVFYGLEIHVQHFFFPAIGVPLLVLSKDELKKTKYFFSVFSILLYFGLDGYFMHFSSLIEIDSSATLVIRTVNDLMVLLVVFILFYLFKKESSFHKEQTDKVKEKNIELEHFAYIASHDLNEPLRTVDSFVEILKKEYHDPNDENISQYFSFIHDALVRMRILIDSLLNYSKLGKIKNFERTDINQVIDVIKKDLNELIEESNLTLKTSDLPNIICNTTAIRQVFQNLITNGIKFQAIESVPVIEISYQEKPSYWQFCVADNGIGISLDKQKEIFHMFTKLHLPSKYKGHGIGLTFCKKIVETHQGRIWVTSSSGRGSQFYFTIPKTQNT